MTSSVADGKASSPLYLKQFFQDLTFADLPSLSLPSSLPNNSLLKYSWIGKDPGLINPSLFRFGERIPSLQDISPILQEVNERQAEGFQGVELTLMEEGWCTIRHVSIEMIRRYTHIHNSTPHIRLASQLHAFLLSHSHAHPSISLTTIIERLSTFLIHRDLPGYSLLVPIYELGSLSGDHEVEDDVANIQLELLHLHHHLAAAPRHFILPVFFSRALLEAYAQSPRTYTPLLSKLRSSIGLSITRQWFAGLSFIHCSGFHYTSYHIDRHGRLFWGNSISGEPVLLQELSDALRWFLDGLGITVASILSMGMPSQKAWSHHCALFALEGIRSRVELGLPWLQLGDIKQLCLEWIVELLTHSFRADLHPHLSWYDIPIASDSDGPVPQFLGSYSWEDDWTLCEVVIQHPIFQVAIPLAPVSILPRSPTHSSFFSDSDEHTSESSYPTSDSDYQPSLRMESLDLLTPRRSAITPPHSQHSTPPSSMHPSAMIDLTTLPSSPPKLTPRPPRSKLAADVEVIDLRTPRKSTKPGKRLRASSLPIVPLSIPQTSHTKKPCVKKARLAAEDDSRSSDESVILVEQQPRMGWVFGHAVQEGDVFGSLADAKAAVKAAEEARGFVMVTGQTKRPCNGIDIARISMRCQSYRRPFETHDIRIHPSDHRKAKSHKTDCPARVNLCPQGSHVNSWYISTLQVDHNHAPPLPPGGMARQAPTAAHKATVAEFVCDGNFNRQQIRSILRNKHPDDILEMRQISNLINSAHQEGLDEIEAAGGDMNALIQRLEQANREDVRNTHRVRTTSDGRVVGLWWQTAAQHSFLLQYPDIVLNDNSYGRNKYGYCLNVGVGIDGSGKSRNLWYALQEREDVASYEWVLQNHLDAAGGKCPEVFASDRDPGLEAAVKRLLPLAFHILCLSHLGGNIHDNTYPKIRDQWSEFVDDFWAVYRAVSPTLFDELWVQLLKKYPSAAPYLQQHVYPDREHFAHAWLSVRFTGGIRTTGRVESENRMIKSLTSPNLNFVQLYDRLLARAEEQHENHLIAVRDSSRRQHRKRFDTAFASLLGLIDEHCGPLALHRTYEELQESLLYSVFLISKPRNFASWHQYFLQTSRNEPGFSWEDGKLKSARDHRRNDQGYISSEWLFYQVSSNSLVVTNVFKVSLASLSETSVEHLVVLLENGSYLCDCCMNVTLGIVCRHFYAVFKACPHLRFSISMIRKRWLKDPQLDTSAVPPVTMTHTPREERIRAPGSLLTNPLENRQNLQRAPTPPPSTQTVPSQVAFHETQSALKPILKWIRTCEDLDSVIEGLNAIQEDQELSTPKKFTFQDPPVPPRVGRPRTTRLAAGREGKAPKANGGGGQHYRNPPPKPPTLQPPQTRAPFSNTTTSTTMWEHSPEPSQDMNPVLTPTPSVRQSHPSARPGTGPPARPDAGSRVDIIPDRQPSGRKRPCCRICGHPGHNRSTCTER